MGALPLPEHHHMSKSSRNKDNSKRQQPIQQHRAEASRQATGQNKAGRGSGEPSKRQQPTGGTSDD
jgi:hypothetical protein